LENRKLSMRLRRAVEDHHTEFFKFISQVEVQEDSRTGKMALKTSPKQKASLKMAEERIKGAKIIASKYASQEEVDALEDLYFAENRHFDAIIQDTRALVVLGLLAEVEVKDGKKAANYYQLAAVQGNSQAQAALGVLYFTGRGVPQNMI